MIELIFGALLILLFYGYQTLVYGPSKKMNHYQKLLNNLGYHVKVFPFKPFGSSLLTYYKQQQKIHGDEYYQVKREDGQYDLGIYNILNKVVIDLYKPELMQQFLGPKSPYLYHKMGFQTANLRRTLGAGIAFSEDHAWKSKRKIMNQVFNYDFLKANIPTITRIFDENFSRIEKQAAEREKGGPVSQIQMNLIEVFACVLSNVMMECFFGVGSGSDKVEGQWLVTFLNKLNGDAMQQGFKPLSLLFGPKFSDLGLTKQDQSINRRIKIFQSIARQKIEQRIKSLGQKGYSEHSTDLIQSLAKTNQLKSGSDTVSGDSYDIQSLVDQFRTFYTAGTETTSHLLQMIIYYLYLNPTCQQKLRQQINKYIKSDADITNENLKKLTYIDWLQNETTRMYGPGNLILIREATQDHMLKDIPISKGMGLCYSSVPNHYSSKYFKDPLEFKPERWENGMSDIHPYALNGFSGGPRNCIGKHLALLESKIGLIKFMLRYKQFWLPKKDFKMIQEFAYEPEPMQLTVVLAD